MKSVLTFGEILLRLSAPGYTRLFQNDTLQTSFCGAEANVAVSLAMFNMPVSFLTKVPDNAVGIAALNSLRYFNVDVSECHSGSGRMGLYYLEKGASQRPSKIIYDRRESAIALANAAEFNWEQILADKKWFHLSGVMVALSEQMPQICMDACIESKKRNVMVSCDLNYRENLYGSSQLSNSLKKIMPYVDVCIANEEDIEKVLGIKICNNDVMHAHLNRKGYEDAAKEICLEYGCKYVAVTFRESYNANHNGWSAMLYDGKERKAYYSTKYDIDIVDRVGGGDSFTAGIIYGIIKAQNNQLIVDFATASSCLKQTIEGDYNRITEDEVMRLLETGGNGRVIR